MINASQSGHEEAREEARGCKAKSGGRELWVTSLGDGGMYVFDAGAKILSKLIPVGKGPNWVAFSPEGRYCAVSNTTSDDCSVIDTNGRREVARIKVGRAPKRLVAVSVPASAA